MQACTPRTCGSDGVECGDYNDGCDGRISCGTCASNKTCFKGKCITPCSTEVCPLLKYVCGRTGPAYYTCANGSTVDCGTCATGQTCNSGLCVCTPKTCTSLGNYTCGTWANGCNATLNCGVCSSGYACNSNGRCVVQNQTTCIPITCSSFNFTCGIWTNGTCSGALHCGTCPSNQTCTSGKCVAS